MFNFAEQTGSGTVIVVWYYLIYKQISKYRYTSLDNIIITLPPSHIHRHDFLFHILQIDADGQDCIQQNKKHYDIPNLEGVGRVHSSEHSRSRPPTICF